MNGIVKEWVAKAHADFALAGREMRAGRRRSNDGIYFHAQQCIEKLMKAVLTDKGVVPPKTHDLVVLSTELAVHAPLWSWDNAQLRFLTQGAVQFRYPGSTATGADARQAMNYARRLRTALLALL